MSVNTEQCGCLLKMSSSDRIETLIDPSTWDSMNEDMVSLDFIQFHSDVWLTHMEEGSLSLMQMAKIFSALYDYQSNKKLFYVAILTSSTTGG
ncbi:putative acetyl-CoA carboxylase [Rosa chinensis]|uniref:Putative acetyl-CoA carboxylase n=1 Tax=Rosa chinensis TaxID=74649 RepID=A0A2P6PTH8_ROSCH|nr:putative acetyl-CoA carboxylase [Rosa chinensis]